MSKSPSPLRVYSLDLITKTKSSYRVLTNENLIEDYHLFWTMNPIFQSIENMLGGTAFKVMITPDSGTYRYTTRLAAHAILVACVCHLQSDGIITDEEAGLAIIRLDILKG
jgi:hypothetical protein